MIEIQLSRNALSKPIVIFDEMTGGSPRIHIGHIRSIEIVPVGRGKEKYSLQIKGKYLLAVTDVSEAILSKLSGACYSKRRRDVSFLSISFSWYKSTICNSVQSSLIVYAIMKITAGAFCR